MTFAVSPHRLTRGKLVTDSDYTRYVHSSLINYSYPVLYRLYINYGYVSQMPLTLLSVSFNRLTD